MSKESPGPKYDHTNGLKVSVILPSYNHRRFLPERLASIFNQSRFWSELIIVDDGSNDGSVEFLRSYLVDPRVKLLTSVVNSKSPFQQWLKGIFLATGDFIWIAESDDCANEHFLETLLNALVLTSATFGFCRSRIIDEESNTIGQVNLKMLCPPIISREDDGIFLYDGRDFARSHMVLSNSIPNVSACLFQRKSLLKCLQGLDYFRFIGDWYLYLGLLNDGSIVYVSEALNLFRNHAVTTRYSSRKTEDWQQISEEYLMNSKRLTDLGFTTGRESLLTRKRLLDSASWDKLILEKSSANSFMSDLSLCGAKRVLLVGFGKIGQKLYKVLLGFGFNSADLLAFDTSVRRARLQGQEVTVRDIDELASVHTAQDRVLIASFAYADELENHVRALNLDCSYSRLDQAFAKFN